MTPPSLQANQTVQYRGVQNQLDQQLFELLGLAQRLTRDHALMMGRLAQSPKTASLIPLTDLLL